MSTDIGRLFELAEREIRPEFREELLDLLDADDRAAAPGSSASAEPALLVELDPDRRPVNGRGWRPGVWLGVAAALIVVLALAVAPGRSDDPVAPVQTPASTTAHPEACGVEGGTLDLVATDTSGLRVGVMPNGSSFCVVDDLTGAEVAVPALDDGAADVAAVLAPAIVDFGVAGTTAYYYVVAIPEGMPAATILAPAGQARSYPSRVGRRFLVIDADYDPRATPQHVTHDLTVYSATGAVLATLVADIDELVRLRSEEAP